MTKSLFAVGVVLVVAAAAVLYFTTFNLDEHIRTTMESVGSEAFGQPVTVGQVRIELREGAGEISGFKVANPEQYASPFFFEMDRIRINLNRESIKGSPIVLDELLIEAPVVTAEILRDRSINVKDLVAHLRQQAEAEEGERAEQEASPEDDADGDAAELRFVFKHLRIAGVTASLLYPGREEAVSVVLPEIELRELGGTEGVTPTGLALAMTEALADKLLAEVANSRVGVEVNRLKEQAGSAGGKLLKDLDAKLREKLEGN